MFEENWHENSQVYFQYSKGNFSDYIFLNLDRININHFPIIQKRENKIDMSNIQIHSNQHTPTSNVITFQSFCKSQCWSTTIRS